MHMADALLSPSVGATFWAGTLTAIGLSSRRLKRTIDDRMIPLMGVLGAFIFAAQMINFTIPGTGSSGHLGGGLVLAIILGPSAAFLVMASVLTVQGLFFADGGLLALGCNIWNLGFYPCFIAYPLIYRPLAGDGKSPGRIIAAAFVSAVVGLQLGAFSVVLETLFSGKSELPFGAFVLLMQPIHLVIGAVEGLVTGGIVKYVRSARPEILESAAMQRPLRAARSLRTVVVTFAIFAVLAGGTLSWFASTRPDGLEWSIEKVFGRPELPGRENGVARSLTDLQKRTAPMPGYGFRQTESSEPEAGGSRSWPNVDAGTSTAAVLGSAIVLALVVLAGIGIRGVRSRKGGPLPR